MSSIGKASFLKLRLLLSPVAGAAIPLSLSPYNWWTLGIISVAYLAAVTYKTRGREALFLALAFGLGMYGFGASWVFVSINQFGSASVPLAIFLTSLFVLGLAICFSLPFYAYGRWFSHSPWGLLLAFPAIWVLDEWMRTWLFTGFPWLYLGYAHLNTPLAGWAPIFGVLGISHIVAQSASMIVAFQLRGIALKLPLSALAATILLWGGGYAFQKVEWTELDEKPITVGIAQGNIPQERKWDPMFLDQTFHIFHELSLSLWKLDWVIWPEAAIPLLYHQALGDLESLSQHAKKTDTVFITGILYDDYEARKYYNSIVAVGEGSGIAFKTRLVPFGEYVPMESWLRGLIKFFDLPTSVIHPGPAYEKGLQAKDVTIAPSICYEVVYPDLVAERASDAQVLLTISNDAWFGDSIGPLQHFEMAQMRALETGRYLIRATNSGVSGIVNTKGQVVTKGGRDIGESIAGEVYSASGITPFIYWKSYPVVLLAFSILAGIVFIERLKRRKGQLSSKTDNELLPDSSAS